MLQTVANLSTEHDDLTDHAQDFVLLQSLPKTFSGHLAGIHDASNEIQPLCNQLVALILDGAAVDLSLDVVALRVGLSPWTSRHEQHYAKHLWSLNTEMLQRQIPLQKAPRVSFCILTLCVRCAANRCANTCGTISSQGPCARSSADVTHQETVTRTFTLQRHGICQGEAIPTLPQFLWAKRVL